MIVKVDKRETARVCEAVKQYMPRYKIIIEKLEVGDFIFKENRKEVVFEYKTWYDLIWSINEGRLFKQAIKQTENFKHHNVIIEWDEKGQKKALKQIKNKISVDDIYESLAMLSTFTNVIISPNKTISFQLMEKYAKIYLEDETFSKTPPEKSENVAYNFLMLIDGINKLKANSICKQLKLKSIQDLININSKQLMKVSGIGPITAQKIMVAIMKTK